MTPTVARRTRISVERYQKMIATGVLTKCDRVELIEGEMFDTAPTGLRHAMISARLGRLCFDGVGADLATIFIGGPVDLGGFSEPQPDVLLVRPRAYAKIPEAGDVLLAIEISDSSLAYDRGTKASLYARYGIAEYWIVDAEGECVEIYTDPASNTYGGKATARGTELITPRALPSLRITVREIFS
jgi:Uma2 family endonuclease